MFRDILERPLSIMKHMKHSLPQASIGLTYFHTLDLNGQTWAFEWEMQHNNGYIGQHIENNINFIQKESKFIAGTQLPPVDTSFLFQHYHSMTQNIYFQLLPYLRASIIMKMWAPINIWINAIGTAQTIHNI